MRNTDDGWVVVLSPDCEISTKKDVDMKKFRRGGKQEAIRAKKRALPEEQDEEEDAKRLKVIEREAGLQRTRLMFRDSEGGAYASMRPSHAGISNESDGLPEGGEIVIFGDEMSEETRYLSEIEKKQRVSIEIEETVSENIDKARYCCCVSSFRRMDTVYFKESQERLVFPELEESSDSLRRIPGAKPIKSSFPCALGRYEKSVAVSRLESWCYWRSAWIYGDVPPITLQLDRETSPMPNELNLITEDLLRTEYVDDSGPIIDSLGNARRCAELQRGRVIAENPDIAADAQVGAQGSALGYPVVDPMDTNLSDDEIYTRVPRDPDASSDEEYEYE